MTYETYYDKYSEKEIHYVLWPADLNIYPAEIEIKKVLDAFENECEWTEDEAEEWTDTILSIHNAGLKGEVL